MGGFRFLTHNFVLDQPCLGSANTDAAVQCPKVRWQHCAACQARIQACGLADEFQLQSWFIRRCTFTCSAATSKMYAAACSICETSLAGKSQLQFLVHPQVHLLCYQW